MLKLLCSNSASLYLGLNEDSATAKDLAIRYAGSTLGGLILESDQFELGLLKECPQQSLNPSEYLGQQPLVYGNLSHLKRHVSAVPDDLRPDPDEFHEKAAK